MKKLIIAVVCLVVVGLLYYVIRRPMSLGFLEGKWVVTTRGDLVRPITASGKIEPASIVQIKGKASGEVVETPFKDGATVHKGDLIIKLDPIDEQRNVDKYKGGKARTDDEIKSFLRYRYADAMIRESKRVHQSQGD